MQSKRGAAGAYLRVLVLPVCDCGWNVSARASSSPRDLGLCKPGLIEQTCAGMLVSSALQSSSLTFSAWHGLLALLDIDGSNDSARWKVEEIAQYHVGETVTSIHKCCLSPGGAEAIVYGCASICTCM